MYVPVKLAAGKKQGLTAAKIFKYISKEFTKELPNFKLRDVTCTQRNSYVMLEDNEHAQILLKNSALSIDSVYCELSLGSCSLSTKLKFKSKKLAANVDSVPSLSSKPNVPLIKASSSQPFQGSCASGISSFNNRGVRTQRHSSFNGSIDQGYRRMNNLPFPRQSFMNFPNLYNQRFAGLNQLVLQKDINQKTNQRNLMLLRPSQPSYSIQNVHRSSNQHNSVFPSLKEPIFPNLLNATNKGVLGPYKQKPTFQLFPKNYNQTNLIIPNLYNPGPTSQDFQKTSEPKFSVIKNHEHYNSLDPGEQALFNYGIEQTKNYEEFFVPAPINNVTPNGDCDICLESLKNGEPVSRIIHCIHEFHTDCIQQASKVTQRCPVCRVGGPNMEGNCPPGRMTWKVSKNLKGILAGYDECEVIVIKYEMNGGVQDHRHQNPGVWYDGVTWEAYLPDNPEGNRVLEMFKNAWKMKKTFTVGRSLTLNEDNRITWNDIHHKTSLEPNNEFGYPDPTYLTRITEDMTAMGIQ